MSSSNKKTFTTSETSKGATLEVTSDAILLEPTTSEHVLVVTSSSSSNLTGNVDVELEMSPDGVNWCPAKVKQTTTTEETQGDPIEGNEKSVNLIKDINEQSDYKNKFARGKLEYDLLTNQAYQGPTIDEFNRTDASDFMHHMVATNKSFNFSGWFKSNEQPSSTYTPVLFRNGGLDTFENLKVIETDSNTTTQNLCAKELINGTYLEIDRSGKLDTLDTSTSTIKSPWYDSSNQNNSANLFEDGVCIGLWVKFNNYTNSGGSKYTNFFTLDLSNGDEIFFGIRSRDGSRRLVMHSQTGDIDDLYVHREVGTTANPTLFNVTNGDTGWNYLVINCSYDSNSIYEALRISVNGGAFNTGTTNYTISGSGDQSYISSSQLSGVTIDNTIIGNTGYAALNPINENVLIDSAVFIRGTLSDSEVQSLYDNANNPSNANIGTNTISSFFQFGDGPDDNTSTPVVEGTNGLVFDQGTGTATFHNYATTETPYEVFTGDFSTIFGTGAASSISGWFKTAIGATGTLFSNRDSSQGLKVDITSSGIDITHNSTVVNYNNGGSFNDGEWHHFCLRKYANNNYEVVIDTVTAGSVYQLAQANTDWRGSNGFTLLGDGDNNFGAANPASTDASKLTAALSNWSLHTETFSTAAISQLYSNGHARNIENLPDVNSANILHWWKFSSETAPEEDSVGLVSLNYQDGGSAALTTKVIDATGAALVQHQLNGNGMTLSLTKNFDFVNKQWVSDASGEAAICLCFNGFQEQAEYFVLWKTNQTTKSIDFLDNNWHNLVLSYKGRNDLQSTDTTSASYVQEGDIVKFGPLGSSGAYHWTLTLDGQCLKDITGDGQGELGADYIGGLGSGLNVQNNVNTGFAIYNRHFKFIGAPETYIAHTQGGATPIAISGLTVQPAVSAQDTPFSFQGYIDETSFHSQNFWQSAGGINNDIEQEFAATIYGNTAALPLRGASAPNYATGIPYPLNDPAAIGAVSGTSQYINPDRLDASTNPHGGLEAWWRWGDTPQDCAENIHDVIDYAASTIQTPVVLHHLRAIEIDQGDVTAMTSADSIYLADNDGTTPASVTTEFVQVVIQGIVNTACNVRDIADPILQYLRVKFKGAGSTDLGPGKTEASLWYGKRRKR